MSRYDIYSIPLEYSSLWSISHYRYGWRESLWSITFYRYGWKKTLWSIKLYRYGGEDSMVYKTLHIWGERTLWSITFIDMGE